MSDEKRPGSDIARHLGILGSDLSLESGMLVASSLVKNEKLRGVLAGASVAYSVGKKLWDKYSEAKIGTTYIVKIYESDNMYQTLQRWFMAALPEKDQHTIIAKSKIIRVSEDGTPAEDLQPWEVDMLEGSKSTMQARVDIFYDGSRRQDVTIDGHVVSVVVMADQADAGANGEQRGLSGKFRYMTVECPSLEARAAVLNRLTIESQRQVAVRRPVFWTANKWGDFQSNTDVPKRTLEQVVLKSGQMERMVDDLKAFLSQELEYAELGIPYHRGLLLYGDPGTGKTSIASALANSLGTDVYYISLSSVPNDAQLIELLREVSERSVLLLEDIDVAHAIKDRSDEDAGVTMQGLLNALDGFVTPHGLITIMTTNHLEVLDPAFLRPGRVDLLEEISCVDTDQVRRLCEQFIGYVPNGLPELSPENKIAPATVVEVFKRNLRDKTKAGQDLVDELNFKVTTAEKVPAGEEV